MTSTEMTAAYVQSAIIVRLFPPREGETAAR